MKIFTPEFILKYFGWGFLVWLGILFVAIPVVVWFGIQKTGTEDLSGKNYVCNPAGINLFINHEQDYPCDKVDAFLLELKGGFFFFTVLVIDPYVADPNTPELRIVLFLFSPYFVIPAFIVIMYLVKRMQLEKRKP